MKLLELDLAGFGRLVDQTFTFAPGLNLVYGPNEAGKSTLQRAIMALLFGFFDEGRISQEQRAVLAVNKPWAAKAPFAGKLIYALDDGRRFQVKRTFAPRLQTSLMSLPETVDISSQFKSASDGRLFFAETHLGMSRPVFGNVCSVRQAELAALESSAVQTITETIMRLSSAGSADTTTDDALATLEKAMRDDVGTLRARTRPLAQASQRLTDLQNERTAALRARDDLLTQIGALRQTESEVKRLDMDRQQLLYLQALAERDVLYQQRMSVQIAVQTIDQCADEVARWVNWAKFPADLRDNILLVDSERKRLRGELQRLERPVAEAEQALHPALAEMAAAEARISQLADAAHVPADQLPAVQELAIRWQRAIESQTTASELLQKAEAMLSEVNDKLAQLQTEIKPVIALGRSGLGKLQQQLHNARQIVAQAEANLIQAQAGWRKTGMSDAQFLELERTVKDIQSGARSAPPTRQGCNPFSSGGQLVDQAPTELVLFKQIKPIHDEVSKRQVELNDARQALAKQEAEVLRHLSPTVRQTPDEATFERLSARLDDQVRVQEVVNQRRSAVNDASSLSHSAQEACDAAANALLGKLDGLGFTAPDLDQALAVFREQCERKQQLVQEEANLERLQLRMQSLQRAGVERQMQSTALHETEAQLRGLLLQAGIDGSGSNLEDGVSEYEARLEYHRRWVKAVVAHDEATRHHRLFVEAQEREGMNARLAEIEASSAEFRAKYPEWTALKPEQSAQHYATLRKHAEQMHADVNSRYIEMTNAVMQASANLRHPAEIDEEIAALHAEIKHLEWYRDALQLASSEVGQAKQEYQRQFAPRLERFMSEGLAQISDNRYAEVIVDTSSLAVSLTAAERQEPVSVSDLSTGTRDLVYLMLRIAIARLLSRSTETLPLMLDDPLAQFDQGRQERALQFLAQLAGDTQIFLFTKDEWTRDWFEQNLRTSDIHAMFRLT